MGMLHTLCACLFCNTKCFVTKKVIQHSYSDAIYNIEKYTRRKPRDFLLIRMYMKQRKKKPFGKKNMNERDDKTYVLCVKTKRNVLNPKKKPLIHIFIYVHASEFLSTSFHNVNDHQCLDLCVILYDVS